MFSTNFLVFIIGLLLGNFTFWLPLPSYKHHHHNKTNSDLKMGESIFHFLAEFIFNFLFALIFLYTYVSTKLANFFEPTMILLLVFIFHEKLTHVLFDLSINSDKGRSYTWLYYIVSLAAVAVNIVVVILTGIKHEWVVMLLSVGTLVFLLVRLVMFCAVARNKRGYEQAN